MMEKPVIILLVIFTLFLIMTITFLSGRGKFFLVGMPFKSVEEMERFDPYKMMKFIGKCLIVFDISILLTIYAYADKNEFVGLIGAILILIVCIYATYVIRIKKPFIRDEYLEKKNKK